MNRHLSHYLFLRIILILALAALFLATGITTALGANPRCDICKNQISGKYYKAGDSIVCNTCYSRYPKCPGCNMPVRSSKYKYNGKRVCSDCTHKAGRCGSCREVLLGRHYIARHDRSTDGFCDDCYKKKPHCIICDLPYKDMTKTPAGPICRVCMTRLDTCSSCGQPISDKYYTVQHVDGKFCKDCFANQPHCDFCGRPFINGGKTYPDKRNACLHCVVQSVKTHQDAFEIMKDAINFCQKKLDIPLARPFDFIVIDNNQMAIVAKDKRAAEKNPEHVESMSQLRELGFFHTRLTPLSPRPTISILSDLPRAACMETIAHEYAHLWQFSINPALRDPEVIEGFAQWVAAKYLLHNREWSAYSKIFSRKDPAYGKGFQRILAIEKRSGIDGVIAYVKSYQKNKNTRAYARKKAPVDPLRKILPRSLLDGNYSFLKNAIVVTDETVKTP